MRFTQIHLSGLPLVIVLSVLSVLSGALISSCSSSVSSNDERALPKEWYAIATPPASQQLPEPSAEADRAVQDVFHVHSEALSSLTLENSPLDALTHLPDDWVPWHLQGLIASFALSVDGVLGSLLFEGSPSIKGTWQKVQERQYDNQAILKSPARKSDLRITRNTSSNDVSKQIEPSIQAAIATGILSDTKAQTKLRTNLTRYAQNFRNLCRALSSTHFASQWSVESFRLELTFDSSGNVTPVTTAGVSVNFRFDWEKGDEQAAPPSTQSKDQELQKQLQAFVGNISQDIQKVASESKSFKNSPFELEEVRIGIGMSASGDIGIATETASMVGSITFSKDENESINERNTIQLQDTSDTVTVFGKIKNQIKRARFRSGLARAMTMGQYFAETGAKSNANSSSWVLTEIEAEFDLSLEGSLGVTTVDGLGVVVCTFSRKD